MRADARANREDILEAAAQLFVEQGVTVAFRTIAARAGIGVATLHRHFPDREALVNAVADHLHDGVAAIIARCERQWEHAPWTAWTGAVHGLAELGLAPLAASASDFAVREDRVDAFVRVAAGRDMRPVERMLDRAAASGYVPADLDPRRFIADIAIVSRPLPDITAKLLPDQGRWVVDVYLDGLRARARGRDTRDLDPTEPGDRDRHP
ncbi:TetR/AcrR family transcriptional regulator [Nocardia takedensis]|uniref:TetR/AcrR family transcriptional regulator n=1 Tax=Nocardia takedensis TaxID=259390 RepID=UPI0002F74DFA|nr:TetR/AcrR family transcriptional regulator [Nocardia takedensis]